MKRWLMLPPLLTVTFINCTATSNQNGEPLHETAQTLPSYEPPPVAAESRDLSQEDIERLMNELSNWGRWGPNDQLGAANLISPTKRLEATSLVTEGITVSLEHQLLVEQADDVPLPFRRSMLNVPDSTVEPPFMGAVSDNYSVSYHGYSHSHIDSLCHIMYKGQMYNGVSQDTITEDGCSNASIANLQGGIVTRGILFDIPRLKGVPYLEPGTPIYMEDLEAWEEMAGLTVRPGDAIFIRTGRWARRAEHGPWVISELAAGLHASTMPWVKSRDVSFLGSDAAADVVPSQVEGVRLPVHTLTIVAMGVDLFDNQDLEALAETAADLNRWEFMLVAGPLAVQNGTGSPVNAIAIF
ncbi:MAG: cyclase [Acidobacteria bacterium]|nr:cyclase [Acidobacteriota bacterium]